MSSAAAGPDLFVIAKLPKISPCFGTIGSSPFSFPIDNKDASKILSPATTPHNNPPVNAKIQFFCKKSGNT